MQRRLRITLAVTAAVGALALGAGTAFADDSSEMEGNTTPEVSSTGVNGLSGTDQLGTAGQTLGSLSGTPAAPSANADADSEDGDSEDADSEDGDATAATPSTSVLGTGAPSLAGVN
ncbi:MAG TPA: hypothetical protein VK735_26670 [Pseudonocardia sp.]|jgi:hypothetical protein|uniref:hypothetical protein n=1 Tax=Pseudonocardia sp. TaxID=60912 RepID=UPI002D018CB2|nr:hypothetical protein [Pseudonocardia sp.]HTF51044.1 hypothetical protein [Pseudonocardia sp.]